jgi:hypothetical protein
VLYPALPVVSLRSIKSIIASIFVVAILALVAIHPRQYAFPAMMVYVSYGLAKTILLGLVESIPGRDPLNDIEDDEEGEDVEMRPTALAERPGGKGRRRFGRVREAMNPFHTPPETGP